MNASKNNVNQVATNGIVFEALEGREMMSATHHHHHHAAAATPTTAPKPAPAPAPAPVVINNSALTITTTGGILTVIGTTGNDQITISQSGNVFTIQNGNWKTTLTGNFSSLLVKGNNGNDSITLDPTITETATIYGGTGNDTLIGSNASDTFYAGGGVNTLKGGAGKDTFVTIGSTTDTITGGGNADSFWINSLDAITDASIAGNVHRVSSFLNGVSTTLSGQTLAEPAMTDTTMAYKNFSNLPLFNAAGPKEDDIVQGYVGDCWYLSSLASVAKVNPGKITQSVVSLGDGTYAVQFTRNGQSVFARVDANLPTWYSQDAYANTVSKNGNSLWVAIMEKAMTQFMGTTASYSNIDGGWMSTAYDSMGLSNTNIWSTASATDLANQLAANLAANKAVTMAIGTVPAGAPLIGSHAYTVDHVTKDSTGKVVSITLRNPWGIDGAGNDGLNDGYVTITPAQAFAGSLGVTVANA